MHSTSETVIPSMFQNTLAPSVFVAISGGFAHDEDPSLQVCTDAWPVLGFGPLMDGGAAARVTGGRGEESPFRLHMGSWKMQWMLLWLGRR